MKQWVEVKTCGYLSEVPDILEEFYDDIEYRLDGTVLSVDMKVVSRAENDATENTNYLLIFTIKVGE